jgi:hypothetical protein
VVGHLFASCWPLWSRTTKRQTRAAGSGQLGSAAALTAVPARRSGNRPGGQATVSAPRACLPVRASALRLCCARCRRGCCAAAWLSYRGRNRPPCVAACSWGVLIGKCGRCRAAPAGQMRRSPSSCSYRERTSPTKCARSIGGECLANDCDRPERPSQWRRAR